jgi:hypothetical protein
MVEPKPLVVTHIPPFTFYTHLFRNISFWQKPDMSFC